SKTYDFRSVSQGGDGGSRRQDVAGAGQTSQTDLGGEGDHVAQDEDGDVVLEPVVVGVDPDGAELVDAAAAGGGRAAGTHAPLADLVSAA
ncbi:unnamed protein product, partial [Plutella xylostella]